METTDFILSKDLSIQLKALGAKQYSLFNWVFIEGKHKLVTRLVSEKDSGLVSHIRHFILKENECSAYMAEELLNIIPKTIIHNDKKLSLYIEKWENQGFNNMVKCYYGDGGTGLICDGKNKTIERINIKIRISVEGKNLVEALAKMYIKIKTKKG